MFWEEVLDGPSETLMRPKVHLLGFSCLDGGTLVSGLQFNPHVVCQGLIWERKTGERELGMKNQSQQSQHQRHFICSSVFEKEKRLYLLLLKCHYTNRTGITTLDLKGPTQKGLPSPFCTILKLQPDFCIPAELETFHPRLRPI